MEREAEENQENILLSRRQPQWEGKPWIEGTWHELGLKETKELGRVSDSRYHELGAP